MRKTNYSFYAIILLLSCYIDNGESQFFDLSYIDHNIVKLTEEVTIDFQIRSQGRLVEIDCLDCLEVKNNQVKCKNKDVVYLILKIEYLSKNLSATLMFPCQRQNRSSQYPLITSLKSQAATRQIELFWDTSSKETKQYLVDIMDDTSQSSHVIFSDKNYLILDNLKERTLYQVCIAAVDSGWQMSRYRCTKERTDFSKSGPVTNHSIQVFQDKILLSWRKPQYYLDNPQGYIVNYKTESDKTCNTIIINMNNNLIPKDSGCSNVIIKHWQELEVLQISNLVPETEYNIEIEPFIQNKETESLFLTAKTAIDESIQLKFFALENFTYSISKFSDEFLKITFKYDENLLKILILKESGQHANYLFVNKTTLFCKENDIVKVTLKMKLKEGIHFHYNIQCKLVKNDAEILSLNAKYNDGNIHVQWRQKGSMLLMLYYYYDGKIQSIPILPLLNNSYDLVDVADQTTYYICLNTYDILEKCISRFKCVNVKTGKFSIGPVTNVKSIASSEMILVKWDPPIDQADHPKGYIAIYKNQNGFCNSAIINEVNEDIYSALTCGRITRFHINPSNIYVPLSSLSPDTAYNVDIIPIGNSKSPIKKTIVLHTTNQDCFLPCYDENLDLVTQNSRNSLCNLTESLKMTRNTAEQNFFCSLFELQQSMCSNTKFCDFPKCSTLQKVSGCVSYTDYSVTNSSLTVTWSPPESDDEVKGYILLQYAKNQCVQFHLQICSNCSMTLQGPMSNYYKNCQHKNEATPLVYEATFDNLNDLEYFTIYIVPIMENSYLGAIKKLSFLNLRISTPSSTVVNKKVTRSPKKQFETIDEENMDLNMGKVEETSLDHMDKIQNYSFPDNDKDNTDTIKSEEKTETDTGFGNGQHTELIKENNKPPDESYDQEDDILNQDVNNPDYDIEEDKSTGIFDFGFSIDINGNNDVIETELEGDRKSKRKRHKKGKKSNKKWNKSRNRKILKALKKFCSRIKNSPQKKKKDAQSKHKFPKKINKLQRNFKSKKWIETSKTHKGIKIKTVKNNKKIRKLNTNDNKRLNKWKTNIFKNVNKINNRKRNIFDKKVSKFDAKIPQRRNEVNKNKIQGKYYLDKDINKNKNKLIIPNKRISKNFIGSKNIKTKIIRMIYETMRNRMSQNSNNIIKKDTGKKDNQKMKNFPGANNLKTKTKNSVTIKKYQSGNSGKSRGIEKYKDSRISKNVRKSSSPRKSGVFGKLVLSGKSDGLGKSRGFGKSSSSGRINSSGRLGGLVKSVGSGRLGGLKKSDNSRKSSGSSRLSGFRKSTGLGGYSGSQRSSNSGRSSGSSRSGSFGKSGSSSRSGSFGRSGGFGRSGSSSRSGSFGGSGGFGRSGSSSRSGGFGRSGSSSRSGGFGRSSSSSRSGGFGRSGSSSRSGGFGRSGGSSRSGGSGGFGRSRG